MKKSKKILICVILILIIIGSVVLASFIKAKNRNNDGQGKDKAVSEVKYLETKLTALLNSMNNIKYENYKVITSKIDENDTKDATKSSDKNDNSNMGDEKSKTQDKAQASGNGESDSNSQKQGNTNKYSVERISSMSTTSGSVDWSKIKNEIEVLYSIVPTITLDLYDLDTDKNEILKLNTELDNLTAVVKKEDKEKTLVELAKLYSFLPKYLEQVSTNEVYTNVINTKAYVVAAYSIVETENWNQVIEYINKAIESYSKVLNNVTEDTKMYNVNRGYILLNELQNAANIKDKEIFLIKYKNLLEEFNSI